MTRWIRKLGVVAIVVCASTLVGGQTRAHDGEGDDDDGCAQVKGNFAAASVLPPACASPVGLCTAGTLTGGLKGTYALEMATLIPAGHPDVPTVQFFTGVSTLVPKHGGAVLTGVDTGAINVAPPGVVGSGSFSTLLTFTDGVAGWLHIRGVLDLTTGAVSGRYDGTVCVDDP